VSKVVGFVVVNSKPLSQNMALGGGSKSFQAPKSRLPAVELVELAQKR
jgi:hypothetical protein